VEPYDAAMRIAVIGTSGSGKSTLAKALGQALGVPVIEMDAINWQAGWTDLVTHDPDAFAAKVDAAIEAAGWVIDGNYSGVLPAILRRATDLVWLDYSRMVVMGRVLRRSFVNSWTGREIWPGTGNRETWGMWLDEGHPARWAWDTFAHRRARHEAALGDPHLAHLKVHRLRAPREAAALIRSLGETAERT
jgi:adenylate kinase family enzyme